jgi:hypothetical protein
MIYAQVTDVGHQDQTVKVVLMYLSTIEQLIDNLITISFIVVLLLVMVLFWHMVLQKFILIIDNKVE